MFYHRNRELQPAHKSPSGQCGKKPERKQDRGILSKDRFQPSGWLVIDAIDFVVHIFSSEQRKNYAIEQLWKDAEEILVDEL